MSAATRSRPPLIHRARLAPPRRQAIWVQRDRLLARLDAVPAGDVICLVTPSGFGKSALVADWLDTRCIPAAWLTLDAADNDLPTFVSHLIAALRTVFPLVGARSLILASTPTPTDPRRLARAFTEDLYDLPQDLRLVLDGLDAITSDTSIGFVETLLRFPTPGVSIILTSRRRMPAPIPLLRSRGSAIELLSRDLAFSRGDVDALLTGVMARQPPPRYHRLDP